MSTMWRSCSSVSESNSMMSSSRLMNSGLNVASAPSRPARDVRGHDQHGVAEVDRAALAVGQAAVVHHLQQDVEDVGVGLLDLVEQDHAVRAPAHRLGELAALLVADVAGRRADEPGHGVLLHVLRHVDADHRVLGVEHVLGERAGELGLADAGGAEEQEGADRPVGVGQARRVSGAARSRPPRPPRAGRRPAGAGGPPSRAAWPSRSPSGARRGCPSTCPRPRRRRRRRRARAGRRRAPPRCPRATSASSSLRSSSGISPWRSSAARW